MTASPFVLCSACAQVFEIRRSAVIRRGVSVPGSHVAVPATRPPSRLRMRSEPPRRVVKEVAAVERGIDPDDYSLKELREMCEEAGVAKWGTKAELAARL